MLHTFFFRIKDKFLKIGATWDELAPNEKQAIEYAHTHINNEPERFIQGTHKYTYEYLLAHSGESINERYRQSRQYKIDEQIADMIDKHTTDTDLILYRGVCDHVYKLMIKNAKKLSDCDLHEKGFMATSLVKDHEIGCKIRLRIYVPSGCHVVYQGNVNDEQNFYEVDIQHGAKLKIISVDATYINCKLIETA